jgi:hypothetical protein
MNLLAMMPGYGNRAEHRDGVLVLKRSTTATAVLSARPQRPVLLMGIQLEQRRAQSTLERELEQAGVDALEVAKGKSGSERDALVEAARKLHAEANTCRDWGPPNDFAVEDIRIGTESLLVANGQLSATMVAATRLNGAWRPRQVSVAQDISLILSIVIDDEREVRGAFVVEHAR